jgi:RimJ/RimL family protein N-acetyltransferase
MTQVKPLNQPVGDSLPGWTPPAFPPREPMEGRYCRLEPLARVHARGLWEANAHDAEGRNWTYLTHGPYPTFEAYQRWLESAAEQRDPQFFAIVARPTPDRLPTPAPRVASPLGVASLMRIDPPNGVIEVGGINFSPLLQRTPAATEAMYLMMRRVFELGYRRYEWKCDALNAPSRRAAQRFGFSYEGVFRQAIVTKGRNRDTAWYACVDRDWPALKAAFEQWLAPGNFDQRGDQRISLATLTSPILVSRG